MKKIYAIEKYSTELTGREINRDLANLKGGEAVFAIDKARG